MATREQERAKFALEKVNSVRNGGARAKFKTQLVKLPARLHANGFGQTVGFYLAAQQGSPEKAICEWLGEWLAREGQPYSGAAFRGRQLIECITGAGVSTAAGLDLEARYREASSEVRALAVWLKRFAEAFIAGDASS